MDVLTLAGAARAASAYVTLSALDKFPQFTDSDGYTRALAQRDTDGAIVVVYARGAVRDIVDTHNERSRITHERGEAAKLAADESLSEADRVAAQALVSESETALAALVKTRAVPTLHVARALAHYEVSSDSEPESETETD